MKPGLGVGVMIIKEGKILLGLRNPNKEKASSELQGQGTWTMAGGKVEFMEKLVDAAKRELEEETGYSSNDIMLVDSYYTSLGFSGERIDLVLALDCFKIGEQHLDKDEFVRYEVVTLEEFEYLLSQSFIMDANARIGYYRYLEYLMKEGY